MNFFVLKNRKSDNSSKIANFKIYKIGLSERLGIHTKKAPLTVHS